MDFFDVYDETKTTTIERDAFDVFDEIVTIYDYDDSRDAKIDELIERESRDVIMDAIETNRDIANEYVIDQKLFFEKITRDALSSNENMAKTISNVYGELRDARNDAKYANAIYDFVVRAIEKRDERVAREIVEIAKSRNVNMRVLRRVI